MSHICWQDAVTSLVADNSWVVVISGPFVREHPRGYPQRPEQIWTVPANSLGERLTFSPGTYWLKVLAGVIRREANYDCATVDHRGGRCAAARRRDRAPGPGVGARRERRFRRLRKRICQRSLRGQERQRQEW